MTYPQTCPHGCGCELNDDGSGIIYRCGSVPSRQSHKCGRIVAERQRDLLLELIKGFEAGQISNCDKSHDTQQKLTHIHAITILSKNPRRVREAEG